MAKGKALYEGHAVAAVAAISAGDRRAGARPDRGRVRGPAARHGCRGGDGGGCAGAARRHLHRWGRSQTDQAVERRQDGPLCQGRCRGRLPRSRCRHRAALYDKARAPGLYRAACLRRRGGAGRADHDLELEPGPVHGPRLYLAHRRRRHRQHPRDPGRNRRRLRRQDDRLSRTGRLHAVEEVGPAGQDRDEPRGGVPRHRADLGRRHRSQARRQEGRPDHRCEDRAQIPVGRISRARRSSRAASADLRSTTCRTPRRSATMFSAIAPRLPHTARRARRSARSGSKAASTSWLASSASTRSECARSTAPRTAARRRTARPGTTSAI